MGGLKRSCGIRVALATSLAIAVQACIMRPGQAAEAWPAAVQARYKLKYEGIGVGHIDFTSRTTGQTYTMSSSGEVSLMFGAIRWVGSSNVSGAIEGASVAPKSYAFDWQKNKKGGAIKMGFAGKKAVDLAVEPPAKTGPEIVPLTEQHKSGVLDPLSAIMALTRADAADPCDRRVAVFDGKQRFDIVFSFKRKTLIPAANSGGASSVGLVCRAVYAPIAGYKADSPAKAYAANRDAEVVLRRVPSTNLLIPHSVTIPTSWGTGSMVIDRVDVTSATAGQFALTE